MRNPVKEARLKYTRGQAFACGIFGLCEHTVLSPRSPPALQGQMIKVLSDGKCPAEQQQEACVARVTSDAAVSRLLPASDFEAATRPGHGGDGTRAGQFADTAAGSDECEEEQRCGDAGQSGLPQDDCRLLRIVTSSESSAERLGVTPDSPFSAARVLQGSPCSFAGSEGRRGAGAAAFQQRVEAAPSSEQLDVHLMDSLRREIAGGRPSRLTVAGLLQLAEESESWRIQMLAAGIVPALVSVFAASDVRAGTGGEGLEESFSLLALFSAKEELRPQIAAEPSVLSAAGYFLTSGSPDSRLDAACMVEKLSVVDSLKEVVGNCSLIMEGVVNLLRYRRAEAQDLGTKSNRVSEQALVKSATKILLALCLHKNNRPRGVKAGAVPALLEILPDAKAVSAERALATLELLATTAEGRSAMTSHALGIPILVGMILKVSNRGTEYAAGALCAICSTGSTRVQEAAIQAGAPTQLLLLIQSDCTPRARRKAMQLLKVLHKLWQESPCNPDSFLIRSKAVLL